MTRTRKTMERASAIEVSAWGLAPVLAALAAAPNARAGGEDTRTRLEQAVHAYYYGSRAEALRRLRPLAEAGCAKAQAKLASVYAQMTEDKS